MKAVVDNDILLKGACYGLLSDLMHGTADAVAVGVLGAARFVVIKRIRKLNLRLDPVFALACLDTFLSSVQTVEPSANERIIAASLEAAAQKIAVSLDAGESQLAAIAISRNISAVLTGDKRAIVALEMLTDFYTPLVALTAKIHCLEQLFRRLVSTNKFAMIRNAVCNEPGIDKTLLICFSCANPNLELASVVEGLDSYIAALRKVSARMLAIT
jgi:predicted nucleic acid-binding protein